jgi:hypothetical protein
MSDRPEPRDPASVLKKHFTTMRVPDTGEPPRYVMSERNRRKYEKILQRVQQLRGGRG